MDGHLCVCTVEFPDRCWARRTVGWLAGSRLFGVLLALVDLLAVVPRDVVVLPHVLDLALHGERKEHDEVDEQDGPEHGHVEGAAERHEQRHDGGLERRVPELELGHAARERAELLALLVRQQRALRLHVNLRRQEADEQVQQVDAQPVRHDVEGVQVEHAQQVERQQPQGHSPACVHVDGRLVQQVLPFPAAAHDNWLVSHSS
ncbi:hypothetical protein ON010_g13923 [Phytophthora cinnamomi]|nr:hypothetical protein ON010_g13923 [Phytophthora cinnamomi]